MTRIDRVLVLMVAVELLAVGYGVAAYWPQPAPPLPNYERLDPVTTAEFVELRNQLRTREPDDWLRLGEAWLSAGYFPEAEACYRQAAKLQSDSFDIYYGWGVCLERLGRTGEAVEAFHLALPLAPPDIPNVCWYHIGRCRLREENVDEAEAAFVQARDFAPALYQRAKIRVRSGRAEEAVGMLDDMLRRAPSMLQLVQLRADAARELGQPDEADFRDRIDRATDTLQLDDTGVFLNSIRFRHGLSRQVLDCQQRWNARGPEEGAACYGELGANMEFWNVRRLAPLVAELYCEVGRPNQAIAVLEELFEYSNETPATLELLGDALFLLQRKDEARRVWERTASIRDGVTVHLKLAEHYERRGETAASRRHTARALHSAGVEDFRNNDLGRAVQALEEAVEFAPEQDHSWFYLGECRRIQGGHDPARAAYERCLELNPAHGRAAAALKRLPAP